MLGTQIRGAETEPLGRAGGEILHEDVCRGDQCLHRPLARIGLQVEGNRLLGPVEPDEVRGHPLDRLVIVAGEVAQTWALHLDDAGTEVGELTGGKRGCHGLLDGDDGEALQDALRWIMLWCVR